MRRKLRDFVHFPVEGLDLSRIMAADTPLPPCEGEEDTSKKEKAQQPIETVNDAEDSAAIGADASEMNGTAVDDVKTTEGGTSTDPSGHDSLRLNEDDGRSEMLYDLYGVVHHQGALSGGHYVASLKSDDGQWRLFNDAQIYEIHSRDVVDSSAYILFYIRRDVKKLRLEDFWNTSPAKEGEGLTEEEMDKLIRGRSDRCVIS